MLNTKSLKAILISIALTSILSLTLSGCNTDTEMSEREHLKRASVFEAQNDTPSAIIEYKNALRQNPANYETRWSLGRLYLRQKQGNLAEKELSIAANVQPDNEKIMLDLVRAYLLQYKYQEVITLLDEYRGTPLAGTAEFLLLYGKSLAGVLRTEEARDAFLQVQDIEPGNLQATIGLAQIALDTNEWGVATQLLASILSDFPDHIDALLAQGDLYRLRGKNRKAIQTYTRVLDLEPRNITAHLSRAHVFLSEGNIDSALIDTDLLEKYVPDYPVSIYLQALAYYSREDYDRAEDAINKVLRAVPEHAPSLLLLSFLQYKLESYEKSIATLDLYLTLNPNNVQARKLMATMELKLGHPEKAISALAPIIDITINDIAVTGLISSAYMQLGDVQKATSALENAIEQNPDASTPLISLGLLQAASNQHELAKKTLESALAIDSESIGINAILALQNLKDKNHQQALLKADKVIEKAPSSPLGYYLKGLTYLDMQDNTNATNLLQQAIDMQEGFIPAIIAISRIEAANGNPNALKDRLEALLSKDTDNPQILTQLAIDAEENKRYFEATQYWQKIVHITPDKVRPYLSLAKNYLSINETRRAVEAAAEARNLHGDDPKIIEVLGVAQLRDGQTEDALKTLQHLISLRPESANFRYRLAQAQDASGDTIGAVESLKKALEYSPDLLAAMKMLVRLSLEQGNSAEAEAIATRIASKHPDRPDSYLLMGKILQAKADYKAAINAYQTGFERSGDRVFLSKLYQSYRLNENLDESRELLQRWLNDHPEDYPVHLLLGNTLVSDGLKEQALKHFMLVTDKVPGAASAHNNLAWLLFEKNDQRALIHAEEAHKLAPDTPAFADTYGWMLVNSDDKQRGIEILQATVKSYPHLRQVRYHLGVAYHRNGQDDLAIRELTRAVSEGPFEDEHKARQLLEQMAKH